MLLQDKILQALRKNKTPVHIYLMSGIKLDGHIEGFDQFIVVLKSQSTLIVYKHAISSIVPKTKQSLKEMLAAGDKDE